MEQSPPWEVNSHSYIQDLLWNPKAHFHVHNSPPLVPVQSQMNPVHISLRISVKIYSNIILPSASKSSEWSLPFRFSNYNIVYISHLFHARYMLRPSHPLWFDDPNNTEFRYHKPSRFRPLVCSDPYQFPNWMTTVCIPVGCNVKSVVVYSIMLPMWPIRNPLCSVVNSPTECGRLTDKVALSWHLNSTRFLCLAPWSCSQSWIGG